MASVDRIWAKLLKKPYSSGIKMLDIDKLLTTVGFVLCRQTSSHRHYKHPQFSKNILTIPCRNINDPVLPIYAKKVYERIIEYGIEL